MQSYFKFHIHIFLVLLSLQVRLNYGHTHRQNRNKKEAALYAVTPPVNHGEGPYYDSENQVLYFVDISGFTIHRVNIVNRNHTSLTLNDTVSFIIPVKEENNKFAIGLGLSVQILTWDGTSDKYELQLVSSVDNGKEGNRFNDAKTDPNGILWAGTIGSESPEGSGYVKPDQGSLNSWSSENCEMKIRLTPVSISNGLAWSRNGSLLFYIDTPTRRIDVFDYNNGTISNRREVFDLEANKVLGFPDGMTIDENDNLWIACWGGSRIIHIDTQKRKLIKTLKLPVEKVTSVTFGGPHLNILFATSMKDGLNSSQLEKQPLAGTTFAITNLGVKGLPSTRAMFYCDKNV